MRRFSWVQEFPSAAMARSSRIPGLFGTFSQRQFAFLCGNDLSKLLLARGEAAIHMIFWSAQGLFLECVKNALYSTFSRRKNKNFLIPGLLIGICELTLEYQLKEPGPRAVTSRRDLPNPASFLAYSPKSTTVPPASPQLNFFIFFLLLK